MQKKNLAFKVILIFVLLIQMNQTRLSPTQAMEQNIILPNRDKIVWASDVYSPSPFDWNPFFWSEAWGSYFMYQPLFDYNYELGGLIGIIGKSMEWSDSTTLYITLRDEAKWSDGVPITAGDVIYTYEYLLSFAKFPAFSSRVDSMEDIDEKSFRVNLKENFPFSRVIWDGFIGFNKIAPKHVWEEIVAKYPRLALMNFHNNWLEPGFNESWKVSSGPYQPYFIDSVLNKEFYKRVDNWWGNTVFRRPNPEYIGKITYGSSAEMNQAFAAGEIDWYGGYYPQIWDLMAENPCINTWTLGEEPYFLPFNAIVELAPNHLKYPFKEEWLRKALAYAINYDELSDLSTDGYIQRARAGWIDDRSAAQKHVYDETIEARYHIDFNVTKAVEILDTYCFKHTDGAWYTDDVPAEDQGMPGTDDDLPDESYPGVNVKLGDWQIMTIDGWIDSMAQSTRLSIYFDNIGISTTPSFVDFGTYVSKFQEMDFELMNLAMRFYLGQDPYTELTKFTGEEGQWTNFTGWYNPEYLDLVEQFEVVRPNSQDEINIASKLQEDLAQNLPSIPMFANAYWYAYNTKYWINWPNKDNNYIHVCAPWDTNNVGVMQLYVINLHMTSPEDATRDIIEDIRAMDLPRGTETRLVNILERALDSIIAGNEDRAVNQLESFLNIVEAQRGKDLTDKEVDSLTESVRFIINNLSKKGS